MGSGEVWYRDAPGNNVRPITHNYIRTVSGREKTPSLLGRVGIVNLKILDKLSNRQPNNMLMILCSKVELLLQVVGMVKLRNQIDFFVWEKM